MFWRAHHTKPDPQSMGVVPLCLWEYKLDSTRLVYADKLRNVASVCGSCLFSLFITSLSIIGVFNSLRLSSLKGDFMEFVTSVSLA